MNLSFLGRGSAFNTKEGNTSAYFIDSNELFLIDCGELVFKSLLENDILNTVGKINIMITHTHADHVGSLGSLITYSYFKLKKDIKIILPDKALHEEDIITLLRIFGCPSYMYEIVNEKEYDKKYTSFQNIRYVETKHSDLLPAYSLIFKTKEGIVFYSGDSKESRIITDIINKKENIDKLYVDVNDSNSINGVHLYIGTLNEIIPDYLKNKVYCIHLNNNNLINDALKMGFNVVEVDTSLKRKFNK